MLDLGAPKKSSAGKHHPRVGHLLVGSWAKNAGIQNFGEEMKRTEGEPWFKGQVSKSDISSAPWPPWNKPQQNQILSGEKWEYHWVKYRTQSFWRQYRDSELTWELTPSLHSHFLLGLLRIGDKASRCQNSGAKKWHSKSR